MFKFKRKVNYIILSMTYDNFYQNAIDIPICGSLNSFSSKNYTLISENIIQVEGRKFIIQN